jgi:SAM-dependent methyltransferase
MVSPYRFVTAPSPRYLLRIAVLGRLFRKYIEGRNRAFLEIGPGLGDVSCYLAEHHAVGTGVVLDRSRESAAFVAERLKDSEKVAVICGDLENLPRGQAFDYVMSFEVLEHIQADLDFMGAINRLTKPGGLWFISVPAYMRKWQTQDEFSGHVRRYEEKELKEKLAGSGFEIIDILDYGFPLTSIMRPLRELYYRPDGEKSDDEKTLASGTRNKMFFGKSAWPIVALLSPFLVLQRLFSPLRKGDGLIVVAQKNA